MGFIKKADQPHSHMLSSYCFWLLVSNTSQPPCSKQLVGSDSVIIYVVYIYILSSIKKQWNSRPAGGLEFKESETHSLNLGSLGFLLFSSTLGTWATVLFNTHVFADYLHVYVFQSRYCAECFACLIFLKTFQQSYLLLFSSSSLWN